MVLQDYKNRASITDRPESFIKSEAYKLICFGVAVALFLDWCAR